MDSDDMILHTNPNFSGSRSKGPDDRRFVGYWGSTDRPHLPDPRDFIGVMDKRERISELLASGNTFAAWRGWSSCRICGARLGTQCLTIDGTWVWPQRLEHYVMEHDLVLPAEFVEHLLTSSDKLERKVQLHDIEAKISRLTCRVANCRAQW